MIRYYLFVEDGMIVLHPLLGGNISFTASLMSCFHKFNDKADIIIKFRDTLSYFILLNNKKSYFASGWTMRNEFL